MTADGITVSRFLFSALLLVFPPYSAAFSVFYLLCGITDVLDGFVARKLHTESEKGAMLDSAADLFFAFIYAVRILPLFSLPLWILIWTAVIAAAKGIGILIAGKNAHGFRLCHSFGNKLTGLLLFLLPMAAYITDVKYGAILVDITASLTAGSEIALNLRKKRQ